MCALLFFAALRTAAVVAVAALRCCSYIQFVQKKNFCSNNNNNVLFLMIAVCYIVAWMALVPYSLLYNARFNFVCSHFQFTFLLDYLLSHITHFYTVQFASRKTSCHRYYCAFFSLLHISIIINMVRLRERRLERMRGDSEKGMGGVKGGEECSKFAIFLILPFSFT